jgi:hypothetical protein
MDTFCHQAQQLGMSCGRMPELGAPENSNQPELMSGVTWAMRLLKLRLSLTDCELLPWGIMVWSYSAMASVVFAAPATTMLAQSQEQCH